MELSKTGPKRLRRTRRDVVTYGQASCTGRFYFRALAQEVECGRSAAFHVDHGDEAVDSVWHALRDRDELWASYDRLEAELLRLERERTRVLRELWGDDDVW